MNLHWARAEPALLTGLLILGLTCAFSNEAIADDARPAWAGDLSTRSSAFGGIGGVRPLLDQYGIAFGLNETFEVLGNPSGGIKQGAIDEGLTQISIGADLSKVFGLNGGLFNVSAFQIHGHGLSSSHLQSLDVVSSIEAEPSTRLNELWLQQSFWGDMLDIKIGQQSADLEFITSEYEDLFINSGFGWPTLPATDLPSGGPAYPLPAPGVRLRAKPTKELTALIGLFDGSPAGLHPGDPQINDAAGTRFDTTSGALLIGEMQYASNKSIDSSTLPGTYKLGAWYNTNRFADAFFEKGATAQPPGILGGIPRSKRGNWSVYGTLDQLIYRPNSESDEGLALTARAMGAPSDRNILDLFLQAGATYKGAFGRGNDTMGLGAEWAHVSDRTQAGDAAAGLPVRSSETVIEATYQAQIEPWWQVQPDVQYVIRPGAGLPDPGNPRKSIANAVVLGIRSSVTF